MSSSYYSAREDPDKPPRARSQQDRRQPSRRPEPSQVPSERSTTSRTTGQSHYTTGPSFTAPVRSKSSTEPPQAESYKGSTYNADGYSSFSTRIGDLSTTATKPDGYKGPVRRGGASAGTVERRPTAPINPQTEYSNQLSNPRTPIFHGEQSSPHPISSRNNSYPQSMQGPQPHYQSLGQPGENKDVRKYEGSEVQSRRHGAQDSTKPETTRGNSVPMPSAFSRPKRPHSISEDIEDFLAQVPFQNISECGRFLNRHKALLEDPNVATQLLSRAERAMESSDQRVANSCLEKALIIRLCQENSPDGLTEFFKKLYARDAKTDEDFQQRFKDSLRGMQQRLKKRRTSYGNEDHRGTHPVPVTGSIPSYNQPPMYPSYTAPTRDVPSEGVPTYAKQASLPSSRVPPMDIGTGQSIAYASQPSYLEPTTGLLNTTSSMPSTTSPYGASGRVSSRVESFSRAAVQEPVTRVARPSALTPNPDTEPGPQYVPKGESFFKPGRVFAMVMDRSVNGRPGAYNDSDSVSDDEEEESGSIRKFIVFRRKERHCTVVPILTYRRRGVSNRRRDASAHAIVHARGVEANSMPGEPRFDKRPISVDMTNPRQLLDKSSRIHFGRVQSISYRAKVMEIGFVSERSMPYFDSYCSKEIGR